MRIISSNKNEVSFICGGIGACTCLDKNGFSAKFIGIITNDECVKSCETLGYFQQQFTLVANNVRDSNERFLYHEEEYENGFIGYYYHTKYQ